MVHEGEGAKDLTVLSIALAIAFSAAMEWTFSKRSTEATRSAICRFFSAILFCKASLCWSFWISVSDSSL